MEKRGAFGDFVLDLGARELVRGGVPVPLSPKALQLLAILLESQPRALSKTELQDRLWPGTFVVEKNLTNLVSEIREALGDDPAHPRFIRTVHRFGYAFQGADPGGGTDSPRHNLPVQLTNFIGRDREIQDLLRMMGSSRLVTLTGAGGCGKTRLALELGAQVFDRFPDGVWVVDLAPLSDAGLVAETVAAVFGIREGTGRSIEAAVADYVRNRQMLLVIDNCEHLITACARLTEALLRSAPRLSVLATSREGLGIAGETLWRVPSLSLLEEPEHASAAALLQSDAVRLFVERASAVDSTFAATAENAGTIARVCARLDGIPLAIELAATRVTVLSVEQIDARLNDRFRLLTGGSRTAVARQRTLEAAVDWSYDLLSDPERRLLRRLAVFAGGWTIDAVEDVASGEELERADVLDLVSRLVDKSLVNVDSGSDESRRYRFLETVRQYARQRLLESGETERVRDGHLAFYFDLARRAEPELTGIHQVEWLIRLDREHDNLRLAIEWCLSARERGEQSATLACALCWFWLKRGYLREGSEYLQRALSAAGNAPSALRARVLMHLGFLTFFQGEMTRSRELMNESETLARDAGDASTVGFALGISAMIALELGDLAECGRLADEGRAAARASATPWVEALPLSSLAYLAMHEGDLDRAAQLHEETLELSRQRGEKWGMGITLFDLGLLRLVQHRTTEARALATEGIALYEEFSDRLGVAWCLGILSAAEALEGHAPRAARLRGAMEGLLERVGAPVQDTYHRWVGDRCLETMKAALGESALEAALAEGRGMSLASAIQFGLKEEAT